MGLHTAKPPAQIHHKGGRGEVPLTYYIHVSEAQATGMTNNGSGAVYKNKNKKNH
jgi:hypothetical protein